MYQVPLTNLPNQNIAFNIDGAYWQIHVYQSDKYMCADIKIDGAAVASGVRCFGGIPLLQYAYMYLPNLGNFVFDSDADYTNFGTSCNLFYLSQSELKEFNSLLLKGAA